MTTINEEGPGMADDKARAAKAAPAKATTAAKAEPGDRAKVAAAKAAPDRPTDAELKKAKGIEDAAAKAAGVEPVDAPTGSGPDEVERRAAMADAAEAAADEIEKAAKDDPTLAAQAASARTEANTARTDADTVERMSRGHDAAVKAAKAEDADDYTVGLIDSRWCVVDDGTPHTGYRLPGKLICSAHEMHYLPDGTPRRLANLAAQVQAEQPATQVPVGRELTEEQAAEVKRTQEKRDAQVDAAADLARTARAGVTERVEGEVRRVTDERDPAAKTG